MDMGDNMNNFDAIMIIETEEDASEERLLEAWQHLVDSGAVWTLQGWYGRTAKALIQQGILTYDS